MDATSEIEVAVDAGGCSVVRTMRCEAPLLVRVISDRGPVLHLALVNGAAGPLGGDTLRFRLHVGPGAHAVVTSVAAAMAQPGPRGEHSTLDIDIVVEDGATLDWAPEPTVSVCGSDHRTLIRVAAASSSWVTLREVVSLGRHNEPPGRLALRQRVVIDGRAVLDHENVFAPGSLIGPGAQGPAKTITSVVTIGGELPLPGAEVGERRASATFHISPTCALSVTTDR
jgi:urease accessory protein